MVGPTLGALVRLSETAQVEAVSRGLMAGWKLMDSTLEDLIQNCLYPCPYAAFVRRR